MHHKTAYYALHCHCRWCSTLRRNLSPDLFCDLSYEIYLRPLLSLSEFIVNLAGYKISCVGSLHSVIVIGEIKDSHVIPVARYEEGNH